MSAIRNSEQRSHSKGRQQCKKEKEKEKKKKRKKEEVTWLRAERRREGLRVCKSSCLCLPRSALPTRNPASVASSVARTCACLTDFRVRSDIDDIDDIDDDDVDDDDGINADNEIKDDDDDDIDADDDDIDDDDIDDDDNDDNDKNNNNNNVSCCVELCYANVLSWSQPSREAPGAPGCLPRHSPPSQR
eukprot:3619935-Rhodomonas_salina.1